MYIVEHTELIIMTMYIVFCESKKVINPMQSISTRLVKGMITMLKCNLSIHR
jgi:hypothetical protein